MKVITPCWFDIAKITFLFHKYSSFVAFFDFSARNGAEWSAEKFTTACSLSILHFFKFCGKIISLAVGQNFGEHYN
jgi:hypothetical protein